MNIRIPRSPLAAVPLLVLAAAFAAPAARADTSNCTVISAVPYTISVAGHYCLASNLVFSGTSIQAIRINQSNVTLDCNNHSIEQASASTTAGVSFTGRSAVTIRNCTFRGFHRGIYIVGGVPRSSRVELHGNTIVGARYAGMQVELRNSLVFDNRVIDTTGLTGINVTADNDGIVVLNDNVVRNITGAGTPATGILVAGTGRIMMDGNRISGVGTAATATAYGIRLLTAASVSPVPASLSHNHLFGPVAVSNTPITKGGTTANSRCDDNAIVSTPGGKQWLPVKGCL